jgi:tetratricopeptide (TPR) repeat protein
MLSLILALLVTAAAFVAGLSAFDVWSGLAIGLGAGLPTYILLVRIGRKAVAATMKEIEGDLKAQRIEKAAERLESLRPYAKWQPGLGPSLDGQIGMLKYAHARDFEGARPFLAKAHPKLWQAWAMLGVAHFKKDRLDDMKAVFETAVKRNPKQPMLWSAYGYCLWKKNQKDAAVAVFARGRTRCPNDERLKHQHEALQNNKKLKPSQNSPEWMALHIDPPPPQAAMAPQRPRYMPPINKLGLRRR